MPTIKIAKEHKKCLVHDCANHTDEGGFIGDLCVPCHQMVTTRNIKRETNTHDALVEALSDMVQNAVYDNEGILSHAQWDELFLRAYAALKLAKGEA